MFLSGDSPIINGDSVTFILNMNMPVYKLKCKISGTAYRDCKCTTQNNFRMRFCPVICFDGTKLWFDLLGSSGQVTFNNIQWRNKNRYYIFRADAITQRGQQFTLKRKFRPG